MIDLSITDVYLFFRIHLNVAGDYLLIEKAAKVNSFALKWPQIAIMIKK